MRNEAIEVARHQLQNYSGDARSSLIQRHLKHHPYRSSVAEMRTRDGSVPVWALVGRWAGVGWDVKQTAIDYMIDDVAVLATIALFERHPEVILDRIVANSA